MSNIKLKKEDLVRLEKLYRTTTPQPLENVASALYCPIKAIGIIGLTKIFNVNRRTIERWFDSWDKIGFASLAIQPGRGAKTRLEVLEKEIGQLLKHHNRNLNNVLDYLEKQHKITICKKTLQNFLKGTGL